MDDGPYGYLSAYLYARTNDTVDIVYLCIRHVDFPVRITQIGIIHRPEYRQ